MLFELLLSTALGLQPPAANPAPAPVPAQAPSQGLKPLSFHSQRGAYKWDTLLPLQFEVDGVKVNSIFFNRRQVRSWPFRGADFGVRAQVEVTNTSTRPKVPGFAVAVFDAENRLLGVGTGGVRVGTLAPGATETFDLNFSKVNERLPLGDSFYLSMELTE